MFLPRLFRPFGPLGLAFMAYRLWRRLPPQRKAEIKERVRGLTRLVSPSGDLPALKVDSSGSGEAHSSRKPRVEHG